MSKKVCTRILCCGLLLSLLLSGCGSMGAEKEEAEVPSFDKLYQAAARDKTEPEADALQNVNGEYIPYGYENLTEELQAVYRQLLNGILEYKEQVSVNACSEADINKVSNMVFADHPEFFWLDQQTYSLKDDKSLDQAASVELQLVYNMETAAIESTKAQIEETAQQWLAQIPADIDTYEKIKYIYEFLSQNVVYDQNSQNNQNLQSVFLNKSTVCMGYAKATQYLLGKLGIFCTLVTGTAAPQDEEHAWNLVKIQENYYYVDTTWGTPGFAEEAEGAAAADTSYTYLCCNDETLLQTHKPSDDMPLPACVDDSYNYYKRNGTWYDTYDREVISQVLADSIIKGKEKAVFKFAGWDGYAQAVADLVEGNLIEQVVRENYAFQQGETFSWNIGYIDEERIITIYW